MMPETRTIVAWFIVRSKPQRETYAKQNLEIRGLEVFLPRVLEVDCDGQEFRPRRPSSLFPGYMFVRMSFPVDYYRVIWTPGVRDLVALGSGPIPVAEAVVEGIRCRCDTSGIVRLRPAPWHPGDRVEIPTGPFAGLLATVVTVMPRRRRIKLLIDFLAQQTPVEMPLTALKAPPGGVPRVGSIRPTQQVRH
jgi:transcriptional antiterminator RfaH